MIDSLGPSDPDEGIFTTLPNGDDLETGSMPCPEKGGAVTDYEEVWRKLLPSIGAKSAWILQSVDGKTFLGKVGAGYMALHEGEGKGFGARREEWDVDHGWSKKYEIGEVGCVPSPADASAARRKDGFEEEESWRAGDIVDIQGKEYVVRAWEDLSGSS